MSYYPSIDEILRRYEQAKDRDLVIIETKRSWRSILSNMLLFFLATLGVVGLNIAFPGANLLGYFTSEYRISLRWLALIPLGCFLEVIRKYHDDLYKFSAHNLTHYEGRLSLNYSVPNIRYNDIRAIVVTQDIWGRLLDYGDVEADTAAKDKSEVHINGVRAPQELAEILEVLRTHSRKDTNEESSETSYEKFAE